MLQLVISKNFIFLYEFHEVSCTIVSLLIDYFNDSLDRIVLDKLPFYRSNDFIFYTFKFSNL